jgi:hypothetical protein
VKPAHESIDRMAPVRIDNRGGATIDCDFL